jgi:hypothetical protein
MKKGSVKLLWGIAGLFSFWKAYILLTSLLAITLLPFYPNFTAHVDFGDHLPYLIWIWGNFDGNHYMEIARNGYHMTQYPFFPLFPILIHFIALFFSLPFLVASEYITNIAIIISIPCLWYLFRIDQPEKSPYLFFACLLCFPTAFFLQSVYNDSLMLFFATMTLLATRRKQWILAGIFGFLGTLTRLNGLALFFPVIIEYFVGDRPLAEQWNPKIWFKSLKNLRIKSLITSGILTSLLIPTAFICYLIYVNIYGGSWMRLFSAMTQWHQDKITLPLQVFWRYGKILLFQNQHQLVYWIAFLEISAVLLYLFLLWKFLKKIRLSYWIFVATSLLIPAMTGTFQGMPRYALHLYPLFLMLYIFLLKQHTYIRYSILTLSVILESILIALFTRGYFVS